VSDKSAIEWTDATWNPTTGCTKVSPACANCYIERTPPFRIKGRKFVKGHIPLVLHADRLSQPLKWKQPRRVFVNSLSDLFHEDVPFEFIDKVFAIMGHASQHTFQILTKRADRMRAYMLQADATELELSTKVVRWPLPNVWLGVSVENQHFADERIPLLLQTPAALRFISAEPLLGPVRLSNYGTGASIDWVIVGGESGPRLRPTKADWVRSMRDQCNGAGVKFFFKQWGGATAKTGGRILDGRTWDELPA
jgi:protein gp37